MRIYLSMNDPGDASFTWISDIATFTSQVLDNEATHIVLDRFLCTFTHNELAPLIEQIVKKMRLNSELVVIETDMDFLSQKITRGEMDIGEINDIMFKNPFSFVSSTPSLISRSRKQPVCLSSILANTQSSQLLCTFMMFSYT